MIENLQAMLSTTRHGVSFEQCLAQCVQTKELVDAYDRLQGTNLARRGSPLDLAIDVASGRLESELEEYIEFCWDSIFMRFGA
ncbi:hypothetical protein HA052_04360 [Chromobacterium haemolyticum]|uniref:HEPN domain-containing protein n=1 Tax=Chromobacterium fluminis TaxID=3044269 RepID=A0ABX0L5Y4_9NEIS|nr:hypothetical protein [Chromobacterium haemolyticum]NHR04423.1 hypothetical protein [Chromobacterium haemolyticum]